MSLLHSAVPLHAFPGEPSQVRPTLCRVRTRRLRAVLLIFDFSSFFSPPDLLSNAATSCHCSFVPMFSHPIIMNKETQLQLFSYTQGFCAEALTASLPNSAPLTQSSHLEITSPYLLIEHGCIQNTAAVG